ncbi:MAG: DegT/DnrJ/EryC1/StrS family aminotransferase, partial [Sulfuricaulis sp.]|nr:DegT/DnrJ/EryC1/StrS family aminotransferase [Sulfuricaulis sp.]
AGRASVSAAVRDMRNPHQVTKDFEAALCEYTGAPFAVTTSSCTMALLLAVAWHVQKDDHSDPEYRPPIEIPKRTYISVPMSIIHAGGRPTFRDEEWSGRYQLIPLPIWDSARWFYAGMYPRQDRAIYLGRKTTVNYLNPGQFVCVSFHASKTLGLEQGGAILHDNPEADAWLRRARFDGRTEGVAPKDDTFNQLAWHCYLNPSTAAQGILKLHSLPRHNDPLPNDEYPNLSEMEIFK